MAAYSNTITNVLNVWADMGVFAYLLPFLLIFALIFGILSRTKMLGENKGVNAILAGAIGLMALQFDWVSNFFATVLPYAGIGLSILLLAFIFMGMISDDEKTSRWIFFAIGALIFLFVIGYAFYDFAWLGAYSGQDWIPLLTLLLLIGGAVVWVVVSSKK
ncbi:MAG: hypothetical protein Q8N63_02370 [Nanoarchaeota archaeon]|nr:hypothetical protein [Nanoarchaeota archaeon]